MGRWQNAGNALRASWPEGRRDLTGPCRTDGTSREMGHKRVQRLPAGGWRLSKPPWSQMVRVWQPQSPRISGRCAVSQTVRPRPAGT